MLGHPRSLSYTVSYLYMPHLCLKMLVGKKVTFPFLTYKITILSFDKWCTDSKNFDNADSDADSYLLLLADADPCRCRFHHILIVNKTIIIIMSKGPITKCSINHLAIARELTKFCGFWWEIWIRKIRKTAKFIKK